MRVFAKYTLMRCSMVILSLLLAIEPLAYAQYEGQTTLSPVNDPIQAQPAFSQQELDQMLAPIALYADKLLSQILMASTYPLEVVEAARWSRANPNLRGDDAVRAVQQMDWDASVKSLVAFPQILQVMDDKLGWTERMGDAFLAQESQVMDTVQNLRQRAYAAGNLRSNDQIRVEPEGQTIVVEPANPEIVYVPYYDPTMVYGPWWWADYPPIYWAPWPGYYLDSGFAWGFGITISTGFFFADCDWHHRRVNLVNVNNYYYNRIVRDEKNAHSVNLAPGVWQHDPDHRRGVPYRDESIRQRYGRGMASPDARRDFRGYATPALNGRDEHGNRQIESGGMPVMKSRPGDTVDRHDDSSGMRAETHSSAGGGQASRLFERDSHVWQNSPREVSRPAVEVRPHVFEDIGHGPKVRDYSSRGRSSYEGTVHGQGGSPAQRSSGNATGGGRMQRSR